jgi:hypothetical protein
MSTRVVTYATVRERVSERQRGVSGRVWQRTIIAEYKKKSSPTLKYT